MIFLSPFGRGINRYEYAGETDLIEALEDLGSRYLLEPGRVFLAGFSMGGGAAFTLVQKYPGRFAGAVGWSCNIVHRYAANLSGKRLVYLSGARDTMFDYPGNHAILDGLRHDRGAEVVVNHRLAGGHHFSLHNIHNDVMLAYWASMPPETEATESGCFLTDDLRYRDAGLVEVREAIRPGELSEVSYRRKGRGLDIRTRNVERLKVRRPADIVRVTVNGTGIGIHIDGECEVAGLGGMGGAAGKPTDEDLNATGSGIAEIYYGPVTIVEGDWREERTNPAQKWAKRLARAMARPVYYGDFREKYAVIPVLPASACELADLEGRSLVLVGSRNENRWLRHLEHAIGARPLMENLAAAVDRPVCAMVFKTRGLWPGTRTVFALVEDGAALAAFADSDLFKGQFTPPFAGQAALLRHDALVLCRDGEIHAFRFDARWTPIPLALTSPGVPHDRFS
ncbi:hypothetical protein MCP1_70113 [Candidatus Terasakiella magnetica]|nr:hypothetical protein MCP1_70113 [Candidatus Terasakiella magnetica]